MSYLYMIVIAFGLYLILRLHWIAALVCLALGCGVIPLFRRNMKKQKLAYGHFTDTCLYLESMLYSFAKEGKIQSALEDVEMALQEGQLKDTLSDAKAHLMLTFDESEVTRDSLDIIESRYACKRVRSLHEFMLHVESYGGDMTEAIRLLDEDRRRWQLRILDTIREREKSFKEVILSVVASIAICGCVLHLPLVSMDISGQPLVQILALVMLLLDLLVVYQAQRFLLVDWSNLDVFEDGEHSREKLEKYRSYDARKEARLSYVLSAIALFFVILFVYFKLLWLALIAASLGLLFLNQHTIGHWLQKRALVKEIKSAFPNWLIDLILLLQTENVQVAIQKSVEQAPEVLAGDVKHLEDQLLIDPESSAPYHNFLKDLSLPQISSAMSMLYSLSMGNSVNGRAQMVELIDGNYRLLDEAEKVRLKDKSSGMYLLFLAPVLVGALKLVVDMAVFMVSFVGTGIGV